MIWHLKPLSILMKLRIRIEMGIDYAYRRFFGVPLMYYSKITPDLFLGGQYKEKAISTFHKEGITAIVNMRTTTIHSKTTLDHGIVVKQYPTTDWTAPSIDDLSVGSQFIVDEIKRGGKVYVHCHLGLGRGPSMALAYLMRIGMTFDDALDEVTKVRGFVTLNDKQTNRLREFEQYLHSEKK